MCKSPIKGGCSSDVKKFSVDVHVSLNGPFENLMPAVSVFTYKVNVTVKVLDPHHGPVAGGTKVKVFGSPFLNYSFSQLYCLKDKIVTASFVDSSELHCESPKLNVM